MQSSVNPDKNYFKCMMCNNLTDFARINIPYSYKLLSQELITMNVATRFITT